MTDIVNPVLGMDGKTYPSIEAAASAANAEMAKLTAAHKGSAEYRLARAQERAATMHNMTSDRVVIDQDIAKLQAEVLRNQAATSAAPPVVAMPDTERLGRQDLAGKGLYPRSIDQIINGEAPSQEDFVTALAKREMALADPVWVKRWESGGLLEQQDMLLWNAIITLGQEALKGQ